MKMGFSKKKSNMHWHAFHKHKKTNVIFRSITWKDITTFSPSLKSTAQKATFFEKEYIATSLRYRRQNWTNSDQES